MEFSVSYIQLKILRNTMSPQLTVVYSLDMATPTLVGRVSLLDPKLGGTTIAWAFEDDKPTELVFLIDFPSAVKVEVIN